MKFGKRFGGAGALQNTVKVIACGTVLGATLGLGLATMAGPSSVARQGIADRAPVVAAGSESIVSDPSRGGTLARGEIQAREEIQVAAVREAPPPVPPAAEVRVAAVAPDENPEATTGDADRARPAIVDRRIAVKRGDTLMKVLLRGGAGRRQAYEAIAALSKLFDPRRLKAGQVVTLGFRPADGEARASELIRVVLALGVGREVVAAREPGGAFAAREVVKEFDRGVVRAASEIKLSLYLSAARAGLPVGVIMEMIRILSWDVDFQRDIQPGDRFEVAFERDFDDEGRAVRDGDILFVSLKLGKTDLTYYRYTPSDDRIADYFDDEGRSVRKALLRTPIDGAKLTSRYGKRKHPVLGYTRVHRGVDFGAPKGTPIYAAGDGMIEMARWEGNFGRYVRIRHNAELKTAYAHMTRIAKSARRGKRVRQGQVIGYVGSTGLSTGPHLHYEVIVKGRKTNPMSVKLPTGRKLKGDELTRFRSRLTVLDMRIAEARARTIVADEGGG